MLEEICATRKCIKQLVFQQQITSEKMFNKDFPFAKITVGHQNFYSEPVNNYDLTQFDYVKTKRGVSSKAKLRITISHIYETQSVGVILLYKVRN